MKTDNDVTSSTSLSDASEQEFSEEDEPSSSMKVLSKDALIPNEKTHLLAKDDDDTSKEEVTSYPILPQLCATLVACLGAMSAGITVGYTSPALPELRHPSQPSGVYFGDGETALFAAMLGKIYLIKIDH